MAEGAAAPARLRRLLDSDLAWSFRHSPAVMTAAAVTLLMFGAALLAPWIAPHDPFDLASLNLMDSLLPPVWEKDGSWTFPLGTDDQGRDLLSGILYGTRISLAVGGLSVLFASTLGVGLGLVAGWRGGVAETIIMRLADVQLSFPAILVALLIDGIARTALPRDLHGRIAIYVIVLAIGLATWVQYARTVRASTLVERTKEYVQAARVIGVHPARILLTHVLPNVISPVLVIATIHLATAILLEATLSFLGLGMPPTEPSLGTLIRVGNNFLFSGEWWVALFPGIALALLILAVNLLGDWLRDALDPKLR
jgi:peptide/nickel transport system permease protein